METREKKRRGVKARLAGLASRWLSDFLLAAGAAAVSTGAAMIYPPAGWIAGGVLAIIGGILSALGGGDPR